MLVTKRDGTKVLFDFKKPYEAIMSAFEDEGVEDAIAEPVAYRITNNLVQQDKDMTVEEIQNYIVKELKKYNGKVSKSYDSYRRKQNAKREMNGELVKNIMKKLTAADVQNQNANVDEYSFGGRMGEAASELFKWIALETMPQKFADNHRENRNYIHDLNSREVGMHNCLSLPVDPMMENGVEVRQTDIRKANSIETFCQLIAVYDQVQSLQQFGGVAETHIDWSAVPYIRKSFYKWYNIASKFIPFVKELDWDEDTIKKTSIVSKKYTGKRGNILKKTAHKVAMFLTEREARQGIEGLLHNLNSLQSRSGNQLPFTSINYGTCTLFEGRMFIRLILEGTMKGVGKFHRTAIFPCGIFQYKKGVNDKPGTPNYDLFQLAVKCTLKRLYPNYCNCDWSVQKQAEEFDLQVRKAVITSLSTREREILISKLRKNKELCEKLGLHLIKTSKNKYFINAVATDFPCALSATMGCRTWNGADINFGEVYERNIRSVINTGEMEFPDFLSAIQKDGRGNLAPNTVILPKIAMEAKIATKTNPDGLIDEFFRRLDIAIADSRDELIDRYNKMTSQPSSAANFMWDNNTMVGYVPEEGVISALKHGTLAIGQIGLAETLQILVGCDHTAPEGMALAHKIEALYNQRCSEFKKEYHLNFAVYMTPAENLCYTSMKKFKEEYGEIPNVSDRDFFTNSMHVPVWKDVNPFEKIDIESQLTGYSNAGAITYVELGSSAKNNPEAVEKIIHYAMEKDIPYFALNIPVDTCMSCGYTDEINDCCPECGSNYIMRLRRVTGYLSTDYHHFNPGKIKEVLSRVKHAFGGQLKDFKYEEDK